ncbi:glycosyltransferase family 2 protein [Moheibacter lacus]|uniref:Glycosyltransferase family 2 protein n=1 Tax=Moheibacter lacus TaxID=2745851 RepID=A0A838ZUE9_9FLAO|nr:glycosyltransferase [Moheibacter lacus]MBA5630618.1 glycosyltransferase family 2 protein [Moheibacter lacus]
MLTVCIPVFNWDVSNLVKEIHRQCQLHDFEFEILAVDDCSTNQNTKIANTQIQLSHFQLIQLQGNVGNAEARNILARSAKFDWLLFLDADMIPANDDFIANYLKEIQIADFDIMSGGILYENQVAPEFRLKWLHGKNTEEQIQGKDPYLEIRGNNFLVRKEIFLENPFGGLPENYGYVDTHFGLKLKQAGAKVKIISNPCIHLGLETNQKFIEKFKKAIQNANWMMKNQPEMAENLRIVQMFKKLNKLGLIQPIAYVFKKSEKKLLRNLLSENPSLLAFQLYKLGYFCSLKTE